MLLSAIPILLVLAISACSDIIGPEPTVTPQLATLSVGDNLVTTFAQGGLLYVRATPVDESFRLERGQRVPLEVAVTSGDSERVGLYREHCPARDRGIIYRCFRFTIFMEEGFRAGDMAGYVDAIGGRFHMLYGRTGGVTVFGEPEIAKLANEAAAWPGVASVSSSSASGCLDTCFPFSRSHLFVPLAVDVGAPVPGDGIIQIRSGDRITFTYRQPDGSSLESDVTVTVR